MTWCPLTSLHCVVFGSLKERVLLLSSLIGRVPIIYFHSETLVVLDLSKVQWNKVLPVDTLTIVLHYLSISERDYIKEKMQRRQRVGGRELPERNATCVEIRLSNRRREMKTKISRNIRPVHMLIWLLYRVKQNGSDRWQMPQGGCDGVNCHRFSFRAQAFRK